MMQKPDYDIREYNSDNFDEILEIETTSFTHPMNRNLLLSETEKDSTKTFVLSENKKVIAYAIIDIVLDEVSLLHIAVLSDFRNKGAASALLKHIIENVKKTDASFITLEVRKTNVPAISLYKKYGFEEKGIRKSYYKNPIEDGLIMTLNFEEENEDISDRKQL